jgi:hypothetical protein
MSLFNTLMSKIFGHASSSGETATPTAAATSTSAAVATAPMQQVDIAAI